VRGRRGPEHRSVEDENERCQVNHLDHRRNLCRKRMLIVNALCQSMQLLITIRRRLGVSLTGAVELSSVSSGVS
jgi:hypothetical protein